MGCSGPAEPLPEQALLGASSQKRKNVRVPPPDPEYVDVTSYITEDADVNAWYAFVANLERGALNARNADDGSGGHGCPLWEADT